MKFTETKKFNLEAIPTLEKTIGFKLPEDYLDFIQKGVGTPSEEHNSIINKTGGVSIDWFLDANDIADVLDMAEGMESFYPFGEDCFGNYFLLNQEGKVFFYSHDLEPIKGFKEEKEHKGIYFLFPTFSDYIKNLKPSGLA